MEGRRTVPGAICSTFRAGFRVRSSSGFRVRAPNREAQCLKCRRPVNTIAIPCSSAAAITSASRTEPPGCTTAVAPAAATASRPSRNGKNASDAATDPRSDPAAARCGLHHRHLHRVDAAHLPGADRERPVRAGEDDRVRLHVRADAPGEAQRLPFARPSAPASSRPSAPQPPRRPRPGAPRRRRRAPARAWRRGIDRSSSPGVDGTPAKSATTTRMFAFVARMAGAASSTAGAITASMNVDDDAPRRSRRRSAGSARRCRRTPPADRPRARARRPRRSSRRSPRRTGSCA